MADPIAIIEGLRNFEDAAGEFIRDGPSTGLPGYVRDGYRERCDQFANLPAWARVLGNGPSGALDRICTPYWDDNGWDGPEVGPPPFPGGQCEGVIYTVTLQNNSTSGPFGAPQSRSGPGPVVGAFVTITLPPATGVAGIEFANGKINTLSGGSVAAPTILGVVRQDGQPDLCGDPPAPITPGPNPPPDPGPVGGPVPTPNPDNPTGPPLIPLPPYQDPVYGPIPIVGPTGPTGPPVDPGPPPGDIGDPGGSSDTGAGGEAEGEAPEGSILVGLKIDVLASPPKARQFAPGVFRGACYIYMGVASNLDQDYGGSMLKSGQFFFAEKENLTHWLVSANTGYSHRVTPYYREVEE